MECTFGKFKEEIQIWSEKYYKKYFETETLYAPTIKEAWEESKTMRIMVIVASVIAVGCILFDLIQLFKNRMTSDTKF